MKPTTSALNEELPAGKIATNKPAIFIRATRAISSMPIPVSRGLSFVQPGLCEKRKKRPRVFRRKSIWKRAVNPTGVRLAFDLRGSRENGPKAFFRKMGGHRAHNAVVIVRIYARLIGLARAIKRANAQIVFLLASWMSRKYLYCWNLLSPLHRLQVAR